MSISRLLIALALPLALTACDSVESAACSPPQPLTDLAPTSASLFGETAIPLSRWFPTSAASMTVAPIASADVNVRVESRGGIPTLLVAPQRAGDVLAAVTATNDCGASTRVPVRLSVSGLRVYDGRTLRPVTTNPPVSPELVNGVLPDVLYHNPGGSYEVLEQATLTLDHRTRTDVSATLTLRFTSCQKVLSGSASLSPAGATTLTLAGLTAQETGTGTLRLDGTVAACLSGGAPVNELVMLRRD